MITLSNIVRTFGSIRAIDNLSFDIREGEILGLLGPNGAGKSTLISIIAGLLEPDSGTVRIGNGNSGPAGDGRSMLGVAPQALALYDDLTAEENLSFFGTLYRLAGRALRKRVAWSLEFSGLTDRRRDRVSTYSGGMKRRLNLAAALLHDPKALLLDEPTVGVDPQSRNSIFDSIEALHAAGSSSGITPLRIVEAAVVRERTRPQNAYAVSFPQGIIWGMTGCAAAFGISLVLERMRGTLIRLRIAPISRMQILAGKALACFLATITISVCLLLIGAAFFGVRPSWVAHLAAAVVCSSSAFVGIMMFLSVLGKTERSAGGIGWAALLVMSMLGGGMIPLFVMPAWMQTLSGVSPMKWAVLAIEGALWRNFSLQEMLLPCGILLGIGLISFSLGVRAFKWNHRTP